MIGVKQSTDTTNTTDKGFSFASTQASTKQGFTLGNIATLSSPLAKDTAFVMAAKAKLVKFLSTHTLDGFQGPDMTTLKLSIFTENEDKISGIINPSVNVMVGVEQQQSNGAVVKMKCGILSFFEKKPITTALNSGSITLPANESLSRSAEKRKIVQTVAGTYPVIVKHNVVIIGMDEIDTIDNIISMHLNSIFIELFGVVQTIEQMRELVYSVDYIPSVGTASSTLLLKALMRQQNTNNMNEHGTLAATIFTVLEPVYNGYTLFKSTNIKRYTPNFVIGGINTEDYGISGLYKFIYTLISMGCLKNPLMYSNLIKSLDLSNFENPDVEDAEIVNGVNLLKARDASVDDLIYYLFNSGGVDTDFKISLDIIPGHNDDYTSFFLKDQLAASEKRIFKLISDMSGGKFNFTGPLFVNSVTLLGGTYVNKTTGLECDLREITPMYIKRFMFGENRQTFSIDNFHSWHNVVFGLNNAGDQNGRIMRYAAINNIFNTLFNGQWKQTHIIERKTLNPLFITEFFRSINEGGFIINTPSTNASYHGTSSTIGVVNYNQFSGINTQHSSNYDYKML